MKRIDCLGLSCPEPVIKTKKGLSERPEEAEVLVDSVASVENVSRYARSLGYHVEKETKDGATLLHLKK